MAIESTARHPELPADLKAKLGQPETTTDAAALVDKDRAAGADIVKLFTGSIVAPNYITPMRVEIARAAVDEDISTHSWFLRIPRIWRERR